MRATEDIVRLWAEIADPENWREIEAASGGYIRSTPKVTGKDYRRLPWPGYVGPEYKRGGLLLMGINGGVTENIHDSLHDSNMRLNQAQSAFLQEPSASSFEALMRVNEKCIPQWPFWRKFVAGHRVPLTSISYINALAVHTVDPRSGASVGFSDIPTAVRRAIWNHGLRRFCIPQIRALNPGVIVVVGTEVARYLADALGTGRDVPRVLSLKARAPSVSEMRETWAEARRIAGI